MILLTLTDINRLIADTHAQLADCKEQRKHDKRYADQGFAADADALRARRTRLEIKLREGGRSA